MKERVRAGGWGDGKRQWTLGREGQGREPSVGSFPLADRKGY